MQKALTNTEVLVNAMQGVFNFDLPPVGKGPTGPVIGLPNCGVVALAATTGKDVEVIMAWFRGKYGYSKRWKGRLHFSQLLHFVRAHKNIKARGMNARGSLRSWVENETALSTQRGYIARVGGHFVAVIAGDVIDQYEIKPVADHWASNKRVTNAVEIVLR
jgi:hypothetical protein